jgi:dolichyl-phosphate-mannose--protein O-mannosyl transferase
MSTPGDRAVSGWATGFSWFAGAIMVMIGGFHALMGLAAIIDDDFFRDTQDYAYDLDPVAYGWIHLILGIVLVLVGFGIFRRADWARTIGILLVVLSAFVCFFFIPSYPVGAVLIIALDIVVICALAADGTDIRDTI